jgi:hypothetical protein
MPGELACDDSEGLATDVAALDSPENVGEIGSSDLLDDDDDNVCPTSSALFPLLA